MKNFCLIMNQVYFELSQMDLFDVYILATVSVLTLVNSWNNFFTPLLVLNTQKKFTLPMGVMDFMGEHAADWNLILAFLTLAMIPAVILYVLCQKYIVVGLTSGAIKG